jgi:hypothetical protein
LGFLFELLPLLEAWEYVPKETIGPISISADKELLVHELNYPGWLLWSIASFSDPLGSIIIRYYSLGRIYEYSITPYVLYELGATVPTPAGFICSRYDTTKNIYVVAYTPTNYPAFNTKCTTSIKAPKLTAMNLLHFANLSVRITDVEKFKQSLKKVLQ